MKKVEAKKEMEYIENYNRKNKPETATPKTNPGSKCSPTGANATGERRKNGE